MNSNRTMEQRLGRFTTKTSCWQGAYRRGVRSSPRPHRPQVKGKAHSNAKSTLILPLPFWRDCMTVESGKSALLTRA